MYTGTLIEDLLATVNRAEKSARVLAAQKRQLDSRSNTSPAVNSPPNWKQQL